MDRREFLFHSGGGLGGIALAEMLGREQLLADAGNCAPMAACTIPPRRNASCSSSWPAPPATSISSTSSRSWSSTTASRRTSASTSRRFRTASAPGCSRSGISSRYGQCGKHAQRSRSRRSATSSTTSPSSTTWSARPASTARARCCRPPASTARLSRHGLLGQLRPRQHERQPADVRRAARPSRPRLERPKNWDSRVPARPASGHRHLSWRRDADRRPVSGRSRQASSRAASEPRRCDLLRQAQPRHTRPRAQATPGSMPASAATNWPPGCSSPRPRRSTSRRSRRTS